MTVSKFIRDIPPRDGKITITKAQADHICDEIDLVRNLLTNLVKAFKVIADRYLVKTRWQKDYRAAKEYLLTLKD